MDVGMFLHIRFLVKTFATEFTWKWSKMNFNFPFKELEYLEITQNQMKIQTLCQYGSINVSKVLNFF